MNMICHIQVKKRHKFEFLQHPKQRFVLRKFQQTKPPPVNPVCQQEFPVSSETRPPTSLPTEPGLPRRRRPTHSRCRRPIASRRVARVRGNCPKSHHYRARVINLLTAQNRARPRRHRAESRRSKPPASPRFARAGLPAAVGSSDQGRGGELGFHCSRA